MSIYSIVSEKDLDNLRKLAEQQKDQRALKFKNRILKQTHDIKLAESLSPITEKLDTINKSTKELAAIVNKSDDEDSITQTPAIENIRGTQSLRDTLSFMKRSKNFFKLQENPDGKIFWNKTLIVPQGGNRVNINGDEFDIKPNIQNYFTNTRLTTKRMDNEDKLIIFNILKNVGFYDNIPKIGLKSARTKDAIFNLPREIKKFKIHLYQQLIIYMVKE